jgi:N-dimethylarginine dimethylaminohydrolase
MRTTAHSEYGKLKSVILKRPEQAFIGDQQIARWKELNFLGKPDLMQANEEYRHFEKLISETGAAIHYLPVDDSATLDSVYCRDATVVSDFGVILCRMGKATRQTEPAASEKLFQQLGIKILGAIHAPGTLEGGDVAWIDNHTIAVGHTYRTNPEGIRQLKRLLEPCGIHVWVAEMPHYKGSSDVFHLMSVFSPVDRNLAVVYSPLMPIRFRNSLLERGFTLIEVPDAEWDSMGCNVLAIAPREVVIVKGNPITANQLTKAGCAVHEYEGTEISLKGGGGPTCLTRPLERLVNFD